MKKTISFVFFFSILLYVINCFSINEGRYVMHYNSTACKDAGSSGDFDIDSTRGYVINQSTTNYAVVRCPIDYMVHWRQDNTNYDYNVVDGLHAEAWIFLLDAAADSTPELITEYFSCRVLAANYSDNNPDDDLFDWEGSEEKNTKGWNNELPYDWYLEFDLDDDLSVYDDHLNIFCMVPKKKGGNVSAIGGYELTIYPDV